jgi:alpha-1,3/alpha-1,6-mannosyltransferase
VYTSHCDPSHCFEEVKDGTLNVVVSGNSIVPPKLFGRFAILCAILRQLHLVINLLLSGAAYDVFIIDQLSAAVPVLRLFNHRVLFYCHFPDQLLALPGGLVKRLYRVPFDFFESWSTNLADVIVVNSHFTKAMFKKTFGSMASQNPEVIYPCVDTSVSFDDGEPAVLEAIKGKSVLLSVNRFERKKDIALALESYNKIPTKTDTLLVLAGGYDPRVTENVEYLKELQQKCDSYGLLHTTIWPKDNFDIPDDTKVLFLPSVSTKVKNMLLNHAKLLLYTPKYEHFGIVPLEAMLAATPVLATDTGGPLETVVEEETGWNRPANSLQWAGVIQEALTLTPEKRAQIGIKGVKRVKEEFSIEKMAIEFEKSANKAAKSQRADLLPYLCLIILLAAILLWRTF